MKKEKIILPDMIRKKDVIQYFQIGRTKGDEIFEKAWEEAEKNEKIPVQCIAEYGSLKFISRKAYAYYLHYGMRLQDSVARKSVPPFSAIEYQDYI
ncbi:hypothetical protein [Peptostreptococcus sp. D1]|uniref:hypothetical protein n=1 Tax=Peptostreptococcus sp. D1 TaxID=72304 RepID=UPI0008EB3599|nr:hypothetical protein [Peptostreptococcus sp. D1]SFE84704.1 hypothetical protein SAMN02910278_01870 [Peptostreptococcus sp. D1]